MSLSSFSETRRRRRRALQWRLLRLLLAAIAIVGVGGYCYQVGVSASEARSAKLEADLLRFQQNNLDLRDRLTLSLQRSDEAESALEGLRERYAADVPRGELAELMALIEAQREAGIEVERLAFMIDAAAEEPACDGAPATKRFVPRTVVSTGPVSFVRFDDRITITGSGEAARTPEGLAQAWFDPGAPVRLDFRALSGEVTTVEGVVPLAHRMRVGEREYRFSVVAGERSFLEISAQACAFPQQAEPDPTAPVGPDDARLG
jgi:hypothetical protein